MRDKYFLPPGFMTRVTEASSWKRALFFTIIFSSTRYLCMYCLYNGGKSDLPTKERLLHQEAPIGGIAAMADTTMVTAREESRMEIIDGVSRFTLDEGLVREARLTRKLMYCTPAFPHRLLTVPRRVILLPCLAIV